MRHAFVTSQGSAYSRLQRALTTGNLQFIEAAAADLPKVSLEDALAILIVLAQRGDPRFERAAARWVGRLLTETPADLSDARFALALVERLPRSHVPDRLIALAWPVISPPRRRELGGVSDASRVAPPPRG